MEIKNVKLRVKATISMGQYEKLEPEIEIDVELSAFKLKTGKLVEVMESAREDMALSLWDMAEQDLKAMVIWEKDEERRLSIARDYSPAFDWMVKLHRSAALDVLAEVVEDATHPIESDEAVLEKLSCAEVEEAVEAEIGSPISGAYVVDLGDEDEADHKQFNEFS